MSGIYSAFKDSPQVQRKKMLDRMMQKVKATAFQEIVLEDFLKDFEFETGASTVKTKEYFDIVAHRLNYDLQFLDNNGNIVRKEDGKKFLYRAEDEEKNIRKTIELDELNAERLKQRLEEIEKSKNSQTVKPS
jgi:hypothetical protein